MRTFEELKFLKDLPEDKDFVKNTMKLKMYSKKFVEIIMFIIQKNWLKINTDSLTEFTPKFYKQNYQ